MNTVISCVVDNDPKFLMQAWNLVSSLMATGDWPKDHVQLLIHHTSTVDKARLSTFGNLGAKLVEVAAWGSGNAVYCNKLRQLESPEILDADVAILLDTDIAVTEPLGPLLSGACVRGKIVDYPCPSEGIFTALLGSTQFAGQNLLTAVPDMYPHEQTLPTNFNGGVYILPRSAIVDLRHLWPKWSNFCLEHSETLGRFAHHADQVGFALAMLESGHDYAHLGVEQNFPLHFQASEYDDIEPRDLKIIHYHTQMDDHGLPKPLGVAWIDEQVRDIAAKIAQQRREIFDNAIFWDYRYASHPELGSGIGSRGDALAYKRSRLAPFFQIYADHPVVDVGCGDLETTCNAPFKHYLGLDLSEKALETARAKRKDWSFSTEPLTSLADSSATLVMCLDVLIHQSESESVSRLVNDLVRVASDAVIVSGYDAVPEVGGIVFAHPPIRSLLKDHPDIADVFEIGQYNDVVLLVGQKKKQTPENPSDIGLKALAWGLVNSPTPELLLNLVQLSRTLFSFFPRTITRTFEYPWVASRLRERVGKRILDVGAGVSVLAPWLARGGASVTTIDNHPVIRDLAKRHEWNEWGYVDFAQFDSRITSVHRDFLTFEVSERFDVICGISVVDHMPAARRRAVIARFPSLLRPGGRVLLTLDLVPGKEDIWRMCQGTVVDPAENHGQISTVIGELEAVGFRLFEKTVIRNIPGSRTDIAMLDLRQESAKGHYHRALV